MNSALPALAARTNGRTASEIAMWLIWALCLTANTFAQNTINTVAGGGVVTGLATGPNADIPGPSAVAKDGQGNTYVAVPAAQEVFMINTAGNLSVFAGIGYATEDPKTYDNKPANMASLNGPSGVFVDRVGNVYIADTTNYLIRKVDTRGIIHTVAGNAHQCTMPIGVNACGDNGPALSATLSSPVGVASDTSGNVYIADTQDHKIRVVNTQKTAITIAGVVIQPGDIATVAGTGAQCTTPTLPCGDEGNGNTGTATAALLNGPQGVAVDTVGNIYIADSGDHRVRVVSTAGIINAYAGNGNTCSAVPPGCGDGGPATDANLSGIWQMSLDNAGDLFITDAPAARIREVLASQTITTVAGNGIQGSKGNGGSPTSANVNSPRGVWVDSSGNFVIGDTGNQWVRLVNTASSMISTLAGGGLGDGLATSPPTAILAADRNVALDTAGNFYIADTANNRIRVTNTQTSPITVAGVTVQPNNAATIVGRGFAGFSDNRAATSAMLNAPDGVALDATGTIYIADTGNKRIRMVNPSTGIITTIAGNGKSCNPTVGCGDGGAATSANLTQPTTVAVDNLGNFYIADQVANQIRMVNSAGTISTLVNSSGLVCKNPVAPSCGDGGSATMAALNGPFGVAADSLGNVYVADTFDNRVRVVNNGIINNYAFTGQGKTFDLKCTAGTCKGQPLPAASATYDTPLDLALDPYGNLYVSGSALFYVIVRVDASAPGNPVAAVAGQPPNPKYYGWKGDGGPALAAAMSNQGVSIDGSGHLFVADTGNNRVREVLLTPTAGVAPNHLTFSPEPIGTTSPPMTFTLNNQGSDDLKISSVAVSGDFSLSPANPCPNNQVAPLLGCTFTVTFTPTTYGVRPGKVIISDNAYQNPTQTVFLTGYGPDFTITANPNTLTVSPGGEGMSTLTLTPSGGFNQTVNLTCSGGPSQSPCTIVPNSLTLDGSDAAMAQLSIMVGSNVQPGNYTLSATGKSVTNHAATIALTVQ